MKKLKELWTKYQLWNALYIGLYVMFSLFCLALLIIYIEAKIEDKQDYFLDNYDDKKTKELFLYASEDIFYTWDNKNYISYINKLIEKDSSNQVQKIINLNFIKSLSYLANDSLLLAEKEALKSFKLLNNRLSNYQIIKQKINLILGQIYTHQNDFQKAIPILEECKKYVLEFQFHKDKFILYKFLGLAHLGIQDFDKALFYFNQSKKIEGNEIEEIEKAEIFKLISFCQNNLNNYEEALKSQYEYMELLDSDELILESIGYLNCGNILSKLGSKKEASALYSLALDTLASELEVLEDESKEKKSSNADSLEMLRKLNFEKQILCKIISSKLYIQIDSLEEAKVELKKLYNLQLNLDDWMRFLISQLRYSYGLKDRNKSYLRIKLKDLEHKQKGIRSNKLINYFYKNKIIDDIDSKYNIKSTSLVEGITPFLSIKIFERSDSNHLYVSLAKTRLRVILILLAVIFIVFAIWANRLENLSKKRKADEEKQEQRRRLEIEQKAIKEEQRRKELEGKLEENLEKLKVATIDIEKQKRERIRIRDGRLIIAEKILFIVKDKGWIEINLLDGTKLIDGKNLTEFYKKLPKPLFYKVGRSHIINILQVKKFPKYSSDITLTNDKKIKIARRNIIPLREFLDKYLLNK